VFALVLASSSDSSIVVDKLCNQTRGQGIIIKRLSFYFTAGKEECAESRLGLLPKHRFLEWRGPFLRALQDQKTVLGGCGPQLAKVVRMLQVITSSWRTFMSIDAIDEGTAVQRFSLLDSRDQILSKSLCARIFVTGKRHSRPEIGKRFTKRMVNLSVRPSEGES